MSTLKKEHKIKTEDSKLTYSSPMDYVDKLAESLTKISLSDFYKNIHDKFYPDQDISFMDYFLELVQHKGKLCVPHTKLFEYGIMTSTQSSHIKTKLEVLQLVENLDFTITDVCERGKTGAQIHKHYYLTPQAFKKCLMRAQRRSNQPVDPVKYCNCYLSLEENYYLYTSYEKKLLNKLLSMKDDKIDRLLKENQEQNKKLDNQSKQIQELLGYAKDTKQELTYTRADLDETREEVFGLREEVATVQETVEEVREEFRENLEGDSRSCSPAPAKLCATSKPTSRRRE